MNKKGVIWEELSDLLLGGSILLVAFVIYLVIYSAGEVNIDKYVEHKVASLNNDDVFISYLNTKLDGTELGDDITVAYMNDDIGSIEEKIDTFLTNIYSAKVCWKLLGNDEELIKKNKCRKQEILMNSTLQMPLPDKQVLDLSLWIGGYA